MWIRNYLFKLIILSVFICFLIVFKASSMSNNKVILIDPGHGGIDGGAVSSSKVLEKDLNLQISLKLRDILESKGYKVFMTRDQDISLSNSGSVKQKKREDLSKRCKMKREVSCDVFLSIHMNKFPDSSVKGAQVWYHINNEKSKRLALSMNNMFKNILKQEKSRDPKGVKNEYAILRDGYENACIIVECGFISNKEEELKLRDSNYQKQFCEAMALAIDDYFNGGN